MLSMGIWRGNAIFGSPKPLIKKKDGDEFSTPPAVCLKCFMLAVCPLFLFLRSQAGVFAGAHS